jgi:C1A family cysteine protease
VAEYALYGASSLAYKPLSEQMCVDCAKVDGCDGGFMSECFDTHLKYGFNYEVVYPYVKKVGACAVKDSTKAANGLNKTNARKWYSIPGDERLMAYVISQKGWISACMNANRLQSYSGGIVRKSNCGIDPNHAIILVGYGTEGGVNYWIGRNSWSDAWGDKGYFKIERGNNACDIATSYEGYRAYLD